MKREIFGKNKLLFIVAAVYAALFAFMPDKALKSAGNSIYYLKEMIEVMPVIFILTALIEAWVPREFIMRGFGEKSGIRGRAFSLIFGSISAGPIYAAFPICGMLLGKGASIANIVIVLSAWAVLKIPMLVNEAKFLGADFMAVRWVLTVAAIFTMAHLTELFVKKADIPALHGKGEVLEIREKYCLGCGMCARLTPQYFEMRDNKAAVKAVPDTGEAKEAVLDSAKKCPAGAISFKSERG